jgi:hypothetical protein
MDGSKKYRLQVAMDATLVVNTPIGAIELTSQKDNLI